jgi:hypothetical protein
MVFGANTYRAFAQMPGSSTEESEVHDAWVTRMGSMPATVVSTALKGPLDWPDWAVGDWLVLTSIGGSKEELRPAASQSLTRPLTRGCGSRG